MVQDRHSTQRWSVGYQGSPPSLHRNKRRCPWLEKRVVSNQGPECPGCSGESASPQSSESHEEHAYEDTPAERHTEAPGEYE
jgi:hypothetical protein